MAYEVAGPDPHQRVLGLCLLACESLGCLVGCRRQGAVQVEIEGVVYFKYEGTYYQPVQAGGTIKYEVVEL